MSSFIVHLREFISISDKNLALYNQSWDEACLLRAILLNHAILCLRRWLSRLIIVVWLSSTTLQTLLFRRTKHASKDQTHQIRHSPLHFHRRLSLALSWNLLLTHLVHFSLHYCFLACSLLKFLWQPTCTWAKDGSRFDPSLKHIWISDYPLCWRPYSFSRSGWGHNESPQSICTLWKVFLFRLCTLLWLFAPEFANPWALWQFVGSLVTRVLSNLQVYQILQLRDHFANHW